MFEKTKNSKENNNKFACVFSTSLTNDLYKSKKLQTIYLISRPLENPKEFTLHG